MSQAGGELVELPSWMTFDNPEGTFRLVRKSWYFQWDTQFCRHCTVSPSALPLPKIMKTLFASFPTSGAQTWIHIVGNTVPQPHQGTRAVKRRIRWSGSPT